MDADTAVVALLRQFTIRRARRRLVVMIVLYSVGPCSAAGSARPWRGVSGPYQSPETDRRRAAVIGVCFPLVLFNVICCLDRINMSITGHFVAQALGLRQETSRQVLDVRAPSM